MTNFLQSALGLDLNPKDLSLAQMLLRAVLLFIAALIMVRTGDKRFFARRSAFDVILGFILASVLSRAINGSAPFFPTIAAGFALVWLHRLLGAVARHWHRFGELIKGHADKVIEDGHLLADAMRKNHLSERDVLEGLRLHGVTDSGAVAEAWMERDGDISVIKKSTRE
jgi:uncharacterized membrane protein YcaP (DUF421 family)